MPTRPGPHTAMQASVASSIAHAEPLPLVPPTVTTGKRGESPSDCFTRFTRSSPISMVRG